MHFVLFTDTYSPHTNSASTQLRHLVEEMVNFGHEVTIVCPNIEPLNTCAKRSITIIGTKYFRSKNKSLVFRFLLELMLPIIATVKLYFNNKKQIDGVIYYSPSIFWSFAVYFVCRQYNCKSYLILRDIFPDWAFDLGIFRNKFLYKFLRLFASVQYLVSDKIGVQSPRNIKYIQERYHAPENKLEVLENWIGDENISDGPRELIQVCKSNRVLVYAGNVGKAQNLALIVQAANIMKENYNFLFVILGGGQEFEKIKNLSESLNVTNLIYHDYIDESALQAVLAVCDVGLVSLDPNHMSNNIPGKFINYLKNGMGVIACVNPKSDLVDLINLENIGLAYCGNDPVELTEKIIKLLENESSLSLMSTKARKVYNKRYQPKVPARRLIDYFSRDLTQN